VSVCFASFEYIVGRLIHFCHSFKFNRRSIEKGLPSDSTAEEKLESLKAQVALKGKLDQFVHRKNAEVLLKDLPPIYDNLLYLPPSQIQKRIMNIHRSKQQRGDISKNFFKYVYSESRWWIS
jgi:hypothetical protein